VSESVDAGAENEVLLSIVMPGFDEELNVEKAVRRVVTEADALGLAFEVIVVDDGSSDTTGAIADRLAVEDDRVRVVHNERNLNYGISLMRGIRASRGEWVLHDGMDLPLAPEDLGLFVPLLGEADVLVASRLDRDAHSRWRRITSGVNRMLLGILFRPRTRDLNFTQFYRRSFLRSLPLCSTSPAFVTPELILRAEHTGRRVLEIPVAFRRREAGRAHFGRPKDIAWTLRDMAALRIRTWLRGWSA
jgi:glycosyltransferase involved in cell wall biosynthesis